MKNVWSKIALLVAVCMFALAGLQTASASAAPAGVVNINTASVGQLQYLKGIGAKKAQAIVEFRASHRFSKVDELEKVKGIGKKLIEKLRSQLVISGQTTLTPPPKKKGKGKKR